MWEGSHPTDFVSDAPQDYHPDNLEDLQLRWVGRSTYGPSTDETDNFDWIKEQVSMHSHEKDYIDDAPATDAIEFDPIMVKLNKIKARKMHI